MYHNTGHTIEEKLRLPLCISENFTVIDDFFISHSSSFILNTEIIISKISSEYSNYQIFLLFLPFFIYIGMALLLLFPLTSNYIINITPYIEDVMEDSAPKVDASVVDDEEDDDDYNTKYVKEFNELPDSVLSEYETNSLQDKQLGKKIKGHDVIFLYHTPTATFWYFTDSVKNMNIDMLNMLSREYAIQYNCKSICSVSEPPKQSENTNTPTNKTYIGSPKSFTTFKNYRVGKDKQSVDTTAYKAYDKFTHYRYQGSLINFSNYKSEREQKNKLETAYLSWMVYKKILEENKIKEDNSINNIERAHCDIIKPKCE